GRATAHRRRRTRRTALPPTRLRAGTRPRAPGAGHAHPTRDAEPDATAHGVSQPVPAAAGPVATASRCLAGVRKRWRGPPCYLGLPPRNTRRFHVPAVRARRRGAPHTP